MFRVCITESVAVSVIGAVSVSNGLKRYSIGTI